MVWVMRSAGLHNYKNTDHVRINVKRGRQAYLYSCTRSGTPTTALTDLPRYERQDDLPPRPPGSGGETVGLTNKEREMSWAYSII